MLGFFCSLFLVVVEVAGLDLFLFLDWNTNHSGNRWDEFLVLHALYRWTWSLSIVIKLFINTIMPSQGFSTVSFTRYNNNYAMWGSLYLYLSTSTTSSSQIQKSILTTLGLKTNFHMATTDCFYAILRIKFI